MHYTLLQALLHQGKREEAKAAAIRAVQIGLWERPWQTPGDFTPGIPGWPWPTYAEFPEVAAGSCSVRHFRQESPNLSEISGCSGWAVLRSDERAKP